MSEKSVVSRCSSKRPVRFHWFDGVSENGDPVDIAVDRCFDAITDDTRLWNPWLASMARAEFRQVIEAACQGKLIPVDQIKNAGHDPSVPLFEIRWQETIQVTQRDPKSGATSHGKALVRLYHSEPNSEPGYFIGHHVHEKKIDPDDRITSQMQSEEISVAQEKYRLGERTRWGLAG